MAGRRSAGERSPGDGADAADGTPRVAGRERAREGRLAAEEDGTSPSALGNQLCNAALGGDLPAVRRLLDSGARANYSDRFGSTPLHYAVYFPGNAGVVRVLLDRGADVNAVTSAGSSAMHWVAWNDPTGECLQMLLGARGDVNVKDERGVTPLHWAAFYNKSESVRTLLAAGAATDPRPWGGVWKDKTPRDLATAVHVRDLL